MDDEAEEPTPIPVAMAVSVNITVADDDTADPTVVLAYTLSDGDLLHVAVSPSAMEDMLPVLLAASIRVHTLTEMITMWPDKRAEILENIQFRWSGGQVGEG